MSSQKFEKGLLQEEYIPKIKKSYRMTQIEKIYAEYLESDESYRGGDGERLTEIMEDADNTMDTPLLNLSSEAVVKSPSPLGYK